MQRRVLRRTLQRRQALRPALQQAGYTLAIHAGAAAPHSHSAAGGDNRHNTPCRFGAAATDDDPALVFIVSGPRRFHSTLSSPVTAALGILNSREIIFSQRPGPFRRGAGRRALLIPCRLR